MATLDTIAASLAELRRSVGGIEGKLDRVVAGFVEREERLRTVENRQHWYSGVGAALGTIFGAIGVKLFH